MQMRAEKRAIDKIYKRRDRYEIPDWQNRLKLGQKGKSLAVYFKSIPATPRRKLLRPRNSK